MDSVQIGDDDTQTLEVVVPSHEDWGHVDDMWEDWSEFYKYHDDRKDDDRKDDDCKDFVYEQWTDQGDYWNGQWKHDEWTKRKHWK